MRGAFRRLLGLPEPDRAALARVKAWAEAALGPHVTVVVNEIACTDPGCPGIETVILIMPPGEKTRACKVQKPADEVTETEVAAALAAP